MKLKLRRKDKEKRIPWTEKVGNKLGGALHKVFSNKKFTTIFIAVVFVFLFFFVIPIRKNIITICILIVLLVLYLIFKSLEKK